MQTSSKLLVRIHFQYKACIKRHSVLQWVQLKSIWCQRQYHCTPPRSPIRLAKYVPQYSFKMRTSGKGMDEVMSNADIIMRRKGSKGSKVYAILWTSSMDDPLQSSPFGTSLSAWGTKKRIRNRGRVSKIVLYEVYVTRQVVWPSRITNRLQVIRISDDRLLLHAASVFMDFIASPLNISPLLSPFLLSRPCFCCREDLVVDKFTDYQSTPTHVKL